MDEILSTVFDDAKDFLNRPMLTTPDQIYAAFLRLPNATPEVLADFVNQNFAPPNEDLLDIVPGDWVAEPPFLDKLTDPDLKNFGSSVNKIWLNLTKFFDHSKYCADCYSSIAVPHPFVVAGGIFTEFYYWDSYWIIHGLLVCGMNNSAKHMIQNYLYLVQTIGFIPNGGRVFFLNRSQPPMLTQMMDAYIKHTGDIAFLKDSYPTLVKEYDFWMQYRTIELQASNQTYTVNRYDVNNTLPRPEAYMDDINGSVGMDLAQRQNYYGQVASAAESGMDFSSKWFREKLDFTTISTKDVIPVELNAIMLKNERTLASMASLLNDSESETLFTRRADVRAQAIRDIFWNETAHSWFDFRTFSTDQYYYITNYVPLWTGEFRGEIPQLIEALGPMLYPAGVPTSLINSTQQWDFPNAWSPHMWFLIEGLDSLGDDSAADLGRKIANRWVSTNYCGWKDSGRMYEKFDVRELGKEGQGGQYPPQAGFGWTNGALLYYLNKYPDFVAPECPSLE